ncbi:radical SAM protein, partial [Mycobacterium ulcerans]
IHNSPAHKPANQQRRSPEHLSDPTRMSESVWRDALVAIRDYADLTIRRCGYDIPVDIIWHGGEPTLLPREYFERVFALQREVFPSDWLQSRRVRNVLQTNLYSVRDEHLDVFEEHDVELGISVDFAEGVRLTAGGKRTEAAVRSNIRRLQDRGLPFSIITVLAGHTVSQIQRVFEEISQLQKPTRLLPLFSGPAARPMNGVTVDKSDILDALMVFFDLWVSAGMTPRVDPLDQYLRTVILKRMGLERPGQDRALLGNDVLVVDRDGRLSCDAYREHGDLGNITETTIEDIVDGATYGYLVHLRLPCRGRDSTEGFGLHAVPVPRRLRHQPDRTQFRQPHPARLPDRSIYLAAHRGPPRGSGLLRRTVQRHGP